MEGGGEEAENVILKCIIHTIKGHIQNYAQSKCYIHIQEINHISGFLLVRVTFNKKNWPKLYFWDCEKVHWGWKVKNSKRYIYDLSHWYLGDSRNNFSRHFPMERWVNFTWKTVPSWVSKNEGISKLSMKNSMH